mgnify:CR=1 FL=1
MSEEKIIQRVPLWLAVAITVLISLPFGVYLGVYNLALWASFIAWAEYFAFGAKPDALKPIFVNFPLGALFMAIFVIFNTYFIGVLGWDPFLSTAVWIFIWVAIAVYIMQFFPILTKYSLAYFNGVSMYLAIYFGLYLSGAKLGCGQGPVVGNPYLDAWIMWVWTSLAGIFGGILGWLNVALTFPKKVE